MPHIGIIRHTDRYGKWIRGKMHDETRKGRCEAIKGAARIKERGASRGGAPADRSVKPQPTLARAKAEEAGESATGPGSAGRPRRCHQRDMDRRNGRSHERRAAGAP